MVESPSLPLLVTIAGRVLCPDCAVEHVVANPAHRGTEREPTREEIVAAFYTCAACDCTGEQAIRDGRVTRR